MATRMPDNSGPIPERKSGIFSKLFALFTVCIAVLTMISGLGGMFDPGRFWYIAFTALGFPILFVLNIALLFIVLLRRKSYAWVPLAALLITVIKLPYMYQWSGSSEKPAFSENQSPEIPVISFNVRLFDLYNWTGSNVTKSKILNFFEKRQPKILCLQEFYSSERPHEDNVKKLNELMNFKSYHVEYPINLYGTDHWGIATFSAFPIVNKGVIYFDKRTANICIFSDIKINNDTIRVYNCHLQSVRFGEKEYAFLENLNNDPEKATGGGEETVRQSKNILYRLKKAFIKRSVQVNLVARHIQESPYPVIVCGDFNDTPSSYTYRTISEGLKDAFRESGSGFGSSYAGPIPGLRIDYILHSPLFLSYGFKVTREKMSDHYPLSANLILNK